MKRCLHRRLFFSLLLCLVLTGTSLTQVSAAGKLEKPKIASGTAVLMDGDTGEVLFNKNMNEKRYPASTTKVMTALLAIENSSLTDQVTMGENAIKLVTPENSNIGSRVGEVFTMEQCLYAILMASANEVAFQVAEYIGGSEENFANMMNERAKEIGCKGTHFTNASGLHDEDHYSTAYDLALILREAIKNPTYVEINSKPGYVIPPTNMNPESRTMPNHHDMFYKESQYYCEGILAGKTGYTDAAKNTLLTAARRDGVTLITAVLRTAPMNYILDTQTLMEYGFANYKEIKAEKAEIRKKRAEEKKKKEAAALTPTPTPTPEPTPTVLPKDAEVPEEFHTIAMVLIGFNLVAAILLCVVLVKKKHGKKR